LSNPSGDEHIQGAERSGAIWDILFDISPADTDIQTLGLLYHPAQQIIIHPTVL
jgi:hypothetical protein